MAAKMKKPTHKSTPQPGAAWRPRIESESEFNPFAGASAAGSHFVEAAEETVSVSVPGSTPGTALLQGSMDRSDADSVETVMSEPLPVLPSVPEPAPRRSVARPKAKAKIKAKTKAKAKPKVKGKAKAKAKAKAKKNTKAKARAKTKVKSKAKALPARKKAKGRARAKK